MSTPIKVKAGWWNAFRPWTLHGAIVPVVLGTMVAAHDGCFNVFIFILTVIGGCLLQSAANLLNTYGDFKSGVDTVENETRSPELVTGLLKPKHVLLMGLACLGVTALIGLVFIYYIGWGIMVYGVLGIIGAGTYTVGLAYKYHGLGQPFVFFMMGILMPLGSYYVQVGAFSWEALLISLPNAFLITAVLCGNEVRDYHEDLNAGVRTLCGRMSYEGASKLYLAENIIAPVILAALIVLGFAPWMCALAFVSMYDLYRLYENLKKAPEDPACNFMLVPLCFKFNWHFGLLLAAGYILQLIVLPEVM
jgi:1,4-dihydroxy-2-naphthoate octaprenyltransferase